MTTPTKSNPTKEVRVRVHGKGRRLTTKRHIAKPLIVVVDDMDLLAGCDQ